MRVLCLYFESILVMFNNRAKGKLTIYFKYILPTDTIELQTPAKRNLQYFPVQFMSVYFSAYGGFTSFVRVFKNFKVLSFITLMPPLCFNAALKKHEIGFLT